MPGLIASGNLVLLYSTSGRECLFIFGGNNRRISHVERIRNIARNGRTSAICNEEDYNYAWRSIRRLGLRPIAEGHSHVDKNSDLHPSTVDVKVIPSGNIEIICFPRYGKNCAWKIADTLEEPLKNKIELILF